MYTIMERSVKYKVARLEGALGEGICIRLAAERRTKGCAITGGASQDKLLLDIRKHVRLHVPVPFTCALSEACVCSAACVVYSARRKIGAPLSPTSIGAAIVVRMMKEQATCHPAVT